MDDRRKKYRAWDAQHSSQEPVSPRDALPEDDLVFFLLDLVPQMDLTPFHQHSAQEPRSQSPFDVTNGHAPDSAIAQYMSCTTSCVDLG